MGLLDDTTIRAALTDLDGWERDGDAIARTFVFDGFRDAIAFIGRIADLAEEADHHPELHNVYSQVTVRLTSHDSGGVTERDVSLARRIQATETL